MSQLRKNNNAFTLVELSVVLVIIGLLIGTVVVGQSILRSSRVQGVLSEVEKFQSGVENFFFQYNNLPGDIPNGELFFEDPPTGLDVDDINGNGDGFIQYRSNAGYEGVRAWNHLILAGLIPGPTTISAYNGTAIPSTHIPRTKLSRGAGYYMASNGTLGFSNIQNVIVIGSPIQMTADNDAIAPGPVLSIHDAISLDTKADDGLITSGFVRIGDGTGAGTCPDDEADIPNSPDNIECIMGFLIGGF